MANLLTTLFASNETYLSTYVSKLNRRQAFPIKNQISNMTFINGTKESSILVSGGTDEERSILLLGLTRSASECTVILHNRNKYLSVDNCKRYGIKADYWDDNIYSGLTKPQMLSIFVSDDKDTDLAFFFAFAFDVCEVLQKPLTIESINEIDWLGIDWQHELLSVTDQRDKALDLLSRYDRAMAEKAVKGVCKLERLTRSKRYGGTGLDEVFHHGNTIVKEVFGSHSPVTRQCIEIIQAKAEKGQQFTLILDDVYIPDAPIIKDNFRNVRLILAGDDLTQYSDTMRLTNRVCNIVAFNHANYGSAKLISETFFGEYDRLYSDLNCGYGKSFLEPRTYNKSITVRQNRDTRLKPEAIASIQVGYAFVRLRNGLEGYISLAEGGNAI